MPSVAQAGRGLALGAIAGLGIYRPPADAPLARRLTGSDLTGVSYRVQAEQGINELAGTSNYHSLQAKAEKRFSGGTYLLVSYTLSRLKTSASDTVQSGASAWGGVNGVIRLLRDCKVSINLPSP